MEITNPSPIEKWQSDFEKESLSALDNLLRGRAYLGKLNRNETSEILFRLFHTKEAGVQRALDSAMRDWFKKYWMAMPPTVSSLQWAEILQNAFTSVQRLNLRETYRWLSGSYFRGRSWLRSLYQGPARDPEAALLLTLALCQQDRTMLPLWIRICRMEENLPLHYASVGLLGLRKLPEEDGTPPGDLEPIVFKSIVDLAEAIDKRCKPQEKKQGEHLWLLECRAIMALLYPRSTEYWIDNFSPLIQQKPKGVAAKWLNEIIPGLFDKMERQRHNREARSNFLSPPSMFELKKILRLLEELPLDDIKEPLQGFLEKHRRYAYQTGVSEFLGKTFRNIGSKIFKQDINMALALVEEAFLWEPYNPIGWGVRAKMEVYRGNYPRSLALLWEAKRRFPWYPDNRNYLAYLLGKNNEYKIAEIIYRQTIADFPKDDVCRNGLAEVLIAQERLKEAEQVYRQTIDIFPKDDVCRNGLAKVLKALGRLEEAEQVYRQTIDIFPKDDVCRNGLAKVLKALGRLEEAEQVYRQTIVDFPKDNFCRTGLAEVLKALGRLEEAEQVYRQAIVDFPDNVVCRTGLAVVLLLRGKRDEAIALLEKTIKAFPYDNKVAKEFLQKVKAGESLPDICEVYKDESISKISAPEEFEVGATPVESAPSPTKIKIGLDEQGKKKASVFETTRVEKKLTDEDNVEKEIGLTNLYRLTIRTIDKEEEREGYKEKAFSLIKEALQKTPDNISALLENGWLLLDEAAENARDFFSNQLKRHPHVLGLHVGNLRYKGQKAITIDNQEWADLFKNFSGSSTVINLEHTLHEMTHGNGSRLTALEILRKQLAMDTNQLPVSLRENEKWAVSLVRQSLFENINLGETLTEDSLSPIIDNYKRHENLLKGIVEQCVSAI